MKQKGFNEMVMSSYLNRVFWFVMCCAHVFCAGPFGLKQMTEYRYLTSLGVCLVGAGTLRLIELFFKKLGYTHLPKEGVLYLIWRILLFMGLSIVLNTVTISTFLYLCDHTSGVDHSSWQSIFDVGKTLISATLVIGGSMILSDLKDVNKAKADDSKTIERIESEDHKIITIPDNPEIPPFDSADFVYSSTNGNYTKIHYIKDHKIEDSKDYYISSLKLEESLKADRYILRVNKQTLLNILYIESIDDDDIKIKCVDEKKKIGGKYMSIKSEFNSLKGPKDN